MEESDVTSAELLKSERHETFKKTYKHIFLFITQLGEKKKKHLAYNQSQCSNKMLTLLAFAN